MSASPRGLWAVLVRRRVLFAAVWSGLLLACVIYCVVAPNEYEARARVALRGVPDSALSLDGREAMGSASVLSAPLQQETLADFLRSDQLAWRVITGLKLYEAPGFKGNFAARFPGFHAEASSIEAREWLLERFERRLHVMSVPRTLVVEVRFRCRDAALSAAVVNALIRAYSEQESETRITATGQASGWLEGQLRELKARMESDRQRLSNFQREHGLLSTPEMLANGQTGESQHTAALMQVDEVGRQLVMATTERIQRESEYRSAEVGDPELVVTANARLQGESGLIVSLLDKIRARRSDLEQEEAQLSAEHGVNFPRVVEIRHELEDLERQKKAEDLRLVEQFKNAWMTAVNRESLVRQSLEKLTGEGMKLNDAAIQYEMMRREADANQQLYVQTEQRLEQAGLSAGVRGAGITVVDAAREPYRPVAPDFVLSMSITFFVGLWVAVVVVLGVEFLRGATWRIAGLVLFFGMLGGWARAQVPTPSTSGLPTGVAKIAETPDRRVVPNPRTAPGVWGAVDTAESVEVPGTGGVVMAAPIGPDDSLEISEYHSPEFHTVAKVSDAGTVVLPMIREISVRGMSEQQAAHAIEVELVEKGMLLHPLVSVVVTAYAGQDVSVLGEVTHPGVYPFTMHHRLLDAISEASGLSQNAGRLVNIFHRDDPNTAHAVVLDPVGTEQGAGHNPELLPGDTVQVSHAGLVYVIGDVIRPGGFPVDPAMGLTVVQALSLAWGPTQNAATTKAVLIREQKSGRTMTTLNLKRMLSGLEPDQVIRDRDILFVPDSMAKNLLNKGVEAAIQSAIGVSIYSGLVYSQRY